MPLINARLDALYRRKLDELNTDLAQRHRVLAVTVEKTRCPNCVWDPRGRSGSGTYNGTGPEPFDGPVCPVCANEGVIEEVTRTRIKAPVRFGEPTTERELPAGALAEGEAELKVSIGSRRLLEEAAWFEVDGVTYERVGQVRYRGLLSKAVAFCRVRRED